MISTTKLITFGFLQIAGENCLMEGLHAQQHSAPNWRREDKPGAVSRLAFMGRGGEETGYFLVLEKVPSEGS